MTAKFAIAIAISLVWLGVSVWLAIPWMRDLADVSHWSVAIFAIGGIAIMPGFMNAFLISSLILDRRPVHQPMQVYPGITILVAAYNEAASIGETLESIERQNYPGPFEVMVIDDGSTDATAGITEALRYPWLTLLRQPRNAGKSAALNRGLALAHHSLVITLDADSYLHANALRHLVERYFTDPVNTRAVAGTMLVRNSRKNWVTRMQEWDYFHGIAAIKRVQSLYHGTLVAQGAFSIYDRQVLRDVGGWDDCVGEDIVLTWAILVAGWPAIADDERDHVPREFPHVQIPGPACALQPAWLLHLRVRLQLYPAAGLRCRLHERTVRAAQDLGHEMITRNLAAGICLVFAGAACAQEAPTFAALGELTFATDTDGFHALRSRAGGLFPYANPWRFAGVAAQSTRYSQGEFRQDVDAVTGIYRDQRRDTLGGVDIEAGVARVAGRLRPIGDATWRLTPTAETAFDLTASGDVVETPAALARGIGYTFFAAGIEQRFGERFTATGLAGWQRFSDGNARIHARARLIWLAVPEQGVTLQLRYRQFSSGQADVDGPYFNPDDYRQWLAVAAIRKRHEGWVYSGALGAGQERSAGAGAVASSLAEVRAEGPVAGNIRLVLRASYYRSAGFIDSPDYASRIIGATLIVPFL
ncbi:MAG: glycosyltransferase [Betaproteobacteria bacterium]